MSCWLTDWCVGLSRCCKSCSGVILARINKHIKHTTLLCSFFFGPYPSALCCIYHTMCVKTLMHTLKSLCLCTWKLCLFFLLLYIQALFCTLVLRATSWGSLQASCLRSQRLSANPTPFSPHRSMQLFPLMIVDQIETHICTRALGFQEVHKKT